MYPVQPHTKRGSSPDDQGSRFVRSIPFTQMLILVVQLLALSFDLGCGTAVSRTSKKPGSSDSGTSTGSTTISTSTTSTASQPQDTTRALEIRFLSTTVDEVIGEAMDPTAANSVLSVELYRSVATEEADSSLVAKDVANRNVVGAAQAGHGFRFIITGKGFSVGDVVAIKAVSQDGARYRVVPSTALTPGPGLSPADLMAIVPTLSMAEATEIAPYLDSAMAEASINTPLRQAAFIAQIAHESMGFKAMEELASGDAYEGRTDLGNTQEGDGRRFKGRGFIQLTGRANYTQCGKDLGLDLVGQPELAAQLSNAARVAAWFWTTRDLNTLADSGAFDKITQRINGGQNGAAERREYYARAKQVLGVTDPIP